MWRMFYRGRFIGLGRYWDDGLAGWTACYAVGDEYGYAYKLKNKGAAKRWLTEQLLKRNPESRR